MRGSACPAQIVAGLLVAAACGPGPSLIVCPQPQRQGRQTAWQFSPVAARPHGMVDEHWLATCIPTGGGLTLTVRPDRVPVVVAGPQGMPWRQSAAGVRATLVKPLGIGLATTGLMVLIGLAVYFRLRRRLLLRVNKALDDLYAADLTAEGLPPGRGYLLALSSSLGALRRRLTAQAELIDRQRQMLQSLIDQLEEGVIVATEDGRIALINSAAMRLLNLAAGPGDQRRLVGQPVESCVPYHALQRLLWPTGNGRSESANAGGPQPGPTPLEIQTDRGTVHVLARASEVMLAEPAKKPGRASVGQVVVLVDVTEQRRTLQLRTDFVANASHELRTPLSTIRAAVETLLSMDLATQADAARAFLEKIDRHSARLQMMVADLLDLSRLEMPTERFEPEPVDCHRFLEDLHSRFAEALERKQLHWQTVCRPPQVRTVHVNPYLLRLTLDNLVDNAVKFTDPGGHVRIELEVSPQEAVFQVIDDGCGIPEEEQQRVFERFYQVQRARSGPERGTGLGLSIVRHAVSAMRGSVHLESRVGHGTRVRVAIPQGSQ